MVEAAKEIRVEIVYAEPQLAVVAVFSLPHGARVSDAMMRAAGDAKFAGIDFNRATLGIYGQLVEPEQSLSDGDRLEIYRPLAEDPKAARRRRARKSR